MNVSSVKNLNGEVFSAVQDASLTNVVQTNSAQWAEGGGAISSFTTAWSDDVPPYGDQVINTLNEKFISAIISNSANNSKKSIESESAKSANYAQEVNETYLENKGFARNLSSEYGTVSVIHNNIIESTNSAISRVGNEGFVSSFEDKTVGPASTASFSWDKSLQNTTFTFTTDYPGVDSTVTYSSNTNLTGEINAPHGTATTFNIDVPNVTSLNIWSNEWISIKTNVASASDTFETTIGELAWASALPSFEYDNTNKISAINGSALAGQGGGGSVSSKYGTISVDGSNIEATNKAIEFNSNGFTSSFDGKSVSNNNPAVFTWDNYSQGTSVHVQGINISNEDATLTYSSNTNVTGEVTTAAYNTFNLDVQIPNATAIQFTSDKNFEVNRVEVTALSSFKVSELAWKSDLPTYNYNSNHKVSAINGSALVGNEDYLVEQGFVQNLTSPKGTVSVLNNNKIEGTNSAIASDVIEGFVSSYNGVGVYPGNSATLTWERYVPNTVLFVSGTEYQEHTLTYSANTDVTGVITTTTGGQISIELPTDSTSIVIGNENWSNTTYNFTVSADDSYEIGELAWASALPTYEYDSTNKISAINGSAIAQPTLSSLNTANVNNVIVTASLPSTTDANTLYLIPEA